MRFIDALLPVLELAAQQCRKLASESDSPAKPVAAAVAEPAPAIAPLAPLGEKITRVRVKTLRAEERNALFLIRDHGPLTLHKLKTLTPRMKPADRLRVLEDLDRYGLTAMYTRGNGQRVVHVTADAQAMLDIDPWAA
jgi:hypothetical protein